MNEVLVSVALCTYNGQKHLAEQLDSIINQTYKNLEIIIVDDCSTDNSFLIACNYALSDQRIKCYRNESNLGFNKNFEKALSLTTGSFISISDQDDIWELNKTQVLLENIKDNWLIFSNSAIIDENGKITDELLLSEFSFSSLNSYKSLLLGNYITGHTTLFSREFLSYILPFPNTGFYDWWMGFIALYHNRLTYLDMVLTKYRHHENAVTEVFRQSKGKANNKYFEIMLNQLKALATYPNFNKIDEDYVTKFNYAFRLKLNRLVSIPLFKIMWRDYDKLYPLLKARKGISKINFAFRFSRRENKTVIRNIK